MAATVCIGSPPATSAAFHSWKPRFPCSCVLGSSQPCSLKHLHTGQQRHRAAEAQSSRGTQEDPHPHTLFSALRKCCFARKATERYEIHRHRRCSYGRVCSCFLRACGARQQLCAACCARRRLLKLGRRQPFVVLS